MQITLRAATVVKSKKREVTSQKRPWIIVCRCRRVWYHLMLWHSYIFHRGLSVQILFGSPSPTTQPECVYEYRFYICYLFMIYRQMRVWLVGIEEDRWLFWAWHLAAVLNTEGQQSFSSDRGGRTRTLIRVRAAPDIPDQFILIVVTD